MPDIWRTLAEMERHGEPGALAIVIAAQGSTPRDVGSKMIVREDGTVIGSVGGGAFEKETVDLAIHAIREGQPLRRRFILEEDLAMRCGGSMEVYVEPINPVQKLVIFGAGHVGAAISKVGAILGFWTVVVDNRPGFASADRLPEANEWVEGEYLETVERLPLDEHAYVVIATHGHGYDDKILQAVIHRPLAYLGMIGSRRKVLEVFRKLREQGVPEENIARIRAPMGLDIGAETPEEIAVSVAAEMVAVRRGVDVSGLAMREKKLSSATLEAES